MDYAAATNLLLGLPCTPSDTVAQTAVKVLAMDAAGKIPAPDPHAQWKLSKPEKEKEEEKSTMTETKKASFKRARKAAPNAKKAKTDGPEPNLDVKPVKPMALEDELSKEMETAIAHMLDQHPECGPRETLDAHIPREAWPEGFFGKHSYTIRSGKARIEVNLKAKHFRIQQQREGIPAIQGSPNVPWTKYGGVQKAWEHAKEISGFGSVES